MYYFMISRLFFLCLIFLLPYSCTESATIEGQVGYPSEYMPQMFVYLKNTETGEVISQKIEDPDNSTSYKFSNVKPGK